jgi:hypothetical protein
MIKTLRPLNAKVRTCAIALLFGAGVGLWMPHTNATSVPQDINAAQPASSPAIDNTTGPREIAAPQPASSPAIMLDTTVPRDVDAPLGFWAWLFSLL